MSNYSINSKIDFGLLFFFLVGLNPVWLKAQQFNSDNYLVMPHGTGTFVLTSGERNSTIISSFALIPKFEFFIQANLFWEDKKLQTPQHFTTTLYAKYQVWINKEKNGGLGAFLGVGNSPGYYNLQDYLNPHKNYWTAVAYTLPLFNNNLYWDIMPGAVVDFDTEESNNTAWGFTYSTRLNIYGIIPKSAIVAELYGTEGRTYSRPEYKIGLRWEPNDFIIPALTYGNNLSGTGAAGFEFGLVIFTPQYLKKEFIKNNHIQY